MSPSPACSPGAAAAGGEDRKERKRARGKVSSIVRPFHARSVSSGPATVRFFFLSFLFFFRGGPEGVGGRTSMYHRPLRFFVFFPLLKHVRSRGPSHPLE